MKERTTYSGAADGGVRDLLRTEGLSLLAVAVALYGHIGGDWRVFALLFLMPDVSFAGYLAGPRVGALRHGMRQTGSMIVCTPATPTAGRVVDAAEDSWLLFLVQGDGASACRGTHSRWPAKWRQAR